MVNLFSQFVVAMIDYCIIILGPKQATAITVLNVLRVCSLSLVIYNISGTCAGRDHNVPDEDYCITCYRKVSMDEIILRGFRW